MKVGMFAAALATGNVRLPVQESPGLITFVVTFSVTVSPADVEAKTCAILPVPGTSLAPVPSPKSQVRILGIVPPYAVVSMSVADEPAETEAGSDINVTGFGYGPLGVLRLAPADSALAVPAEFHTVTRAV